MVQQNGGMYAYNVLIHVCKKNSTQLVPVKNCENIIKNIVNTEYDKTSKKVAEIFSRGMKAGM